MKSSRHGGKLKFRGKKTQRKSILVIVFVIFLTVLGANIIFHKTATSGHVSSDQHQETVPGNPSENAIDKNVYKSTMVGDEPKYINLPTISAGGFIEKVAINDKREMGTPTNINIAGWYVNSVKPGEVGLSIIDGHVDGYTKNGIFFNLKNLHAGDKYSIDQANGKVKNFKVVSVTSYSIKDATNKLFSHDPKIRSQLNLITCGGKYDKKAQAYPDRVIVVSELV